jgi:hypothetical protein
LIRCRALRADDVQKENFPYTYSLPPFEKPKSMALTADLKRIGKKGEAE